MKFQLCLPLITALALSACTETGGGTATDGGRPASESVAALAAPYQDLTAVKVMPDDGCYWYRHKGVVETTWLPLLTPKGQFICTQSKDS